MSRSRRKVKPIPKSLLDAALAEAERWDEERRVALAVQRAERNRYANAVSPKRIRRIYEAYKRPLVNRPNRVCFVEGCGKPTREGRKLCDACRDILTRYGLGGPRSTCIVPGCNNIASRRGLCDRHYRRQIRNDRCKICNVCGEKTGALRRGMCNRCYKREWTKHRLEWEAERRGAGAQVFPR